MVPHRKKLTCKSNLIDEKLTCKLDQLYTVIYLTIKKENLKNHNTCISIFKKSHLATYKTHPTVTFHR